MDIGEDKVMDKYTEIFNELFDIGEKFNPQEIVRGEVKDWDSVGHISLVTRLEESFEIMMDATDILQLDSYTKGIEILKKYGVDL